MLLWHVLVPAVPIPRTPVTRSRLAVALLSSTEFPERAGESSLGNLRRRVVVVSYIELVVSDGEHACTPSPMYVQHIYY